MLATETDLIALARQGDAKAFDKIVAKHRARVVSYCMRLLNNASDAEEQAQEAFVNAWKNFGGYRGDGELSSWLISIAVNTCRNLIRTRKYTEERDKGSMSDAAVVAAVEKEAASPSVEEDAVQREYMVHVMRAIREKSRSARPPWDLLDRRIFLTYPDAGTWSEVARRLDKSVDTVKYRYYNRIQPVLESVRKEMGED